MRYVLLCCLLASGMSRAEARPVQQMPAHAEQSASQRVAEQRRNADLIRRLTERIRQKRVIILGLRRQVTMLRARLEAFGMFSPPSPHETDQPWSPPGAALRSEIERQRAIIATLQRDLREAIGVEAGLGRQRGALLQTIRRAERERRR